MNFAPQIAHCPTRTSATIGACSPRRPPFICPSKSHPCHHTPFVVGVMLILQIWLTSGSLKRYMMQRKHCTNCQYRQQNQTDPAWRFRCCLTISHPPKKIRQSLRFCFLVLVPTSIARYQQIKLKVTQFLTVFVCSSYVLEIGRFFGVYHFDAFSESIWTGAWGSSYFHWGVIGLARKKLEPCFCSFALKSFQWTARRRVGESKIGLCICLALELQDLSIRTRLY